MAVACLFLGCFFEVVLSERRMKVQESGYPEVSDSTHICPISMTAVEKGAKQRQPPTGFQCPDP